jgi:hypothetical protein
VGSRLDSENARWFLDRLAADCTVPAAEIPTNCEAACPVVETALGELA